MIPYKSILQVSKNNKQAIYLQLANQIIDLIKDGVLSPDTKLPSSRIMAELIGLHRKTIVACYDELLIQGWLVSIPRKGIYVHGELPLLMPNALGKTQQSIPSTTGFEFYKRDKSNRPQTIREDGIIYINDGLGDVRLVPVQEIAQIYRSVCHSRAVSKHLGYGPTSGNLELREVLVKYLNETRGIKLTIDNIMITRGSQMGIHLAAQLLINPGDLILVGETNYITADYSFLNAGARLLRIPVDECGIDTKAVEKACQQNLVKAIYVTSHHHHPTTKTMSAERRLHLLNLAQEYKFAIIEDDYDYDFHYNHAPILPLVSHDVHGLVVYTGSFCKTVAPAFRIGYLIAAAEFITEASKMREYIDSQGDPLLELTFARFIKSGRLNRHINKTIKVYRQRRDLFVDHLKSLQAFFEFDIPAGGMAFWLKLKPPYNWEAVAATARKYKLEIGEWQRYDVSHTGHNAIRMGFASYNEAEIASLVGKLLKTMEDLREG
ncbi:MAG: PLP-dependent aminotransferase family protein [Bacteroidota bacterium]